MKKRKLRAEKGFKNLKSRLKTGSLILLLVLSLCVPSMAPPVSALPPETPAGGSSSFNVNSNADAGNPTGSDAGNWGHISLVTDPIPANTEYWISLDYFYPTPQTEHGGGLMLFSSSPSPHVNDPTAFILYQLGKGAGVKYSVKTKNPNTGTLDFFDADIKPVKNEWVNLKFHFIGDGRAEMYVNGTRAKVGGKDTFLLATSNPLVNIGPLGDVSGNYPDGWAFFDNIKVWTADGTILYDVTAEPGTPMVEAPSAGDYGSLAGGTVVYFGAAKVADPPRDHGIPAPESIELCVERPAFIVNDTVTFTLRGTLTDQTALNPDHYLVFYGVDDDTVVELSEVDGKWQMKGLQAGTTTLRASLIAGGTSFTVTQELRVTDSAVPYALGVTLSNNKVRLGDTVDMTVEALISDGSRSPANLADLTVDVSPAGALEVTPDINKYVVKGLQAGAATIDISVSADPTVNTQKSLNVVGISALTLNSSASEISSSLGETAELTANITLSDDSVPNYADWNLQLTADPADMVDITPTVEPNKFTVKAKTATTLGQVTLTATAGLPDFVSEAETTINITDVQPLKDKSTIYTAEKVANARANIARYDWAAEEANSAVAAADQFVALGYDFLWNIVTSQEVRRSYAVNQDAGCPNCGRDVIPYGNYPYAINVVDDPWKITCPSCGLKFPTNDFAAYYAGGLDENGVFSIQRAKEHDAAEVAAGRPSNLVNVLYPEKGPTFGVDDGTGYEAPDGKLYTLIAYYNHWGIWRQGFITDALKSLRDAYVYTGDVKYAKAGLVLLDRIADVYPDMETFSFSVLPGGKGCLNSGHAGYGKVIGSQWETTTARDWLQAYDAFFPALQNEDLSEVTNYLSSRHNGVLKTSKNGIAKNIEDGIVKQIYQGVRKAQIYGGGVNHQTLLAEAAVVLNHLPESREWLDFVFKAGRYIEKPGQINNEITGGNIGPFLVSNIDRDGSDPQGAPGYISYTLRDFRALAELLNGYELYPAADLYAHPIFEKAFHGLYQFMMSDTFMANIGDSGQVGRPNNFLNVADYVAAFERYETPIFAQLVHFLRNGDLDGVRGSIFSADPTAVVEKMKQVIDHYGALEMPSRLRSGFGLAVLTSGARSEYALSPVKRIPFVGMTAPEAVNDGSRPPFSVYIEVNRQFNGTRVGDYVIYEFDVEEAGRYRLSFETWKYSSYAVYDVELDGAPLMQIDYSTGAGAVIEDAGVVDLTAGTHTLKFTCNRMADGGDSYRMSMRYLMLDSNLEAPPADELMSGTLRDVYMNFGTTQSHGHKDALNLGLHFYNLDLAPDLGYPEFASENARRREWEDNTISHNVVMVDRKTQAYLPMSHARPTNFDDSYYYQYMEVTAPRVYNNLEDYRRGVGMIRIDDSSSYVVDFFHVKGGNEHVYSFHGGEASAVSTDGLNLVEQATGTYAGPDVEYGVRPASDTTNSGYHWLKNVERDNAPAGEKFSVDWKLIDTWNLRGGGVKSETDVHMKLTMLGAIDDVALADGIPPTNKLGNPESLRYVLARRTGSNIESLFTSVIEPYEGESKIASIEEVPMTALGGTPSGLYRAVKVTLRNGRVDYVVYAQDDSITYRVDDSFDFRGRFGVRTRHFDGGYCFYLPDGTKIDEVETALSAYTGTVVGFSEGLVHNSVLTVNFNEEIDPLALLGRQIYVANDLNERNATYLIQQVSSYDGSEFHLGLGLQPLTNSYADEATLTGFNYDVAVGQSFRIPLSHFTIFPVPPDMELTDEATGIQAYVPYAAFDGFHDYNIGLVVTPVEGETIPGYDAEVYDIHFTVNGVKTSPSVYMPVWVVIPPVELSLEGIELYHKVGGEWVPHEFTFEVMDYETGAQGVAFESSDFSLWALAKAASTDPTEPDATDPDATEPGTTDPDATDPDATDPDATDPDATDPGTTDPDATEPGTTDPDATESGTTDPDATEPGTTDPDATEPDTTDPDATEPGTTDPGSTEDGDSTDIPPVGGGSGRFISTLLILSLAMLGIVLLLKRRIRGENA